MIHDDNELRETLVAIAENIERLAQAPGPLDRWRLAIESIHLRELLTADERAAAACGCGLCAPCIAYGRE